jgi:hypothetical protein
VASHRRLALPLEEAVDDHYGDARNRKACQRKQADEEEFKGDKHEKSLIGSAIASAGDSPENRGSDCKHNERADDARRQSVDEPVLLLGRDLNAQRNDDASAKGKPEPRVVFADRREKPDRDQTQGRENPDDNNAAPSGGWTEALLCGHSLILLRAAAKDEFRCPLGLRHSTFRRLAWRNC